MSFDFLRSSILSSEQFDVPSLERVFSLAKRMRRIASGEVTCKVLQDNVLGSCFFEESTRTRWSSEAGFMRLGGQVITMWDPRFSSMEKKKETFEDTIRVLSGYVDVIVVRHSEIGKATIAAQYSRVPVINGGDGQGEHPTQALLDAFTIQQEVGRLNDFHIAMVGDLVRGRTVHSLLKILSLFEDVRVTLIASGKWQMPDDMVKKAEQAGCKIYQTDDFERGIKSADVIYMVRPQKERAENGESEMCDRYCLDVRVVENKCKKGVVIMHPLPRNNEIAKDVDDLPNAAYFRQAENGTLVRMALYLLIFGKEDKFV